MTSEFPPELKGIQTFLARANETKQREPLISYFCQLHAAKQALHVPRSPAVQNYLTSLFEILEKEKLSLSSDQLDILSDDDASFDRVEDFATRIFAQADNEDREGLADLKTAKSYLAASVFYDVLHLFKDELDHQIIEKIKYSKWRAAEILKAVKEGRPTGPAKPTSPGQDERCNGTSNDNARQPAVSSSTNLVSFPAALPPVISPKSTMSTDETARRLKHFGDAQRYAKYASEALNYEDVPTARTFFNKALVELDSL